MSKISTNSGSVPMRKEPNYLYLVISLLIAVVLITSAPPLKPLGILGVFTGALSLMATAYIVTERRLHVLLAAVLGAARSEERRVGKERGSGWRTEPSGKEGER